MENLVKLEAENFGKNLNNLFKYYEKNNLEHQKQEWWFKLTHLYNMNRDYIKIKNKLIEYCIRYNVDFTMCEWSDEVLNCDTNEFKLYAYQQLYKN